MFGWKSKKMKKLESIESKIDDLIVGVTRSSDESVNMQKNQYNEIVSEIDKVSTLITEVKRESVKSLSCITERMDSSERSILEKLSLSDESISHQTDIILKRIACLEENQHKLLEYQKSQLSELRTLMAGLEQSQTRANDNINEIEKTINNIEASCFLTQDCIVSSEQLLRMIVLTNVMNEIPEH